MSGGYAERLKKNVWKGKCGSPELFDHPLIVEQKVEELATLISSSMHFVVYTGAGISTSSGITDFRGPNGVWTMQEKGEKPIQGIPFEDASPTLTHMALVALHEAGLLKFIVSQNVDGLHLKSGFPQSSLSELHGNIFKEICSVCKKEYIREKEIVTIGFQKTGNTCDVCGGALTDWILDWNDELPKEEMDRADVNSKKADLALCLGTSLQIKPACNLPIKATRKNGKVERGKLVIVNLQATPRDYKSDLLIHAKCDDVMQMLMKKLNLEIPKYFALEKKIKVAPELRVPATETEDLTVNKKRTDLSDGKDNIEGAKKKQRHQTPLLPV